MNKYDPDELLSALKIENLPEKSLSYLDFHKHRYSFLLKTIDQLINEHLTNGTAIKLLDIGPAFQTFLIRKYFPSIQVDTLGYNHVINITRPHEKHYRQNLNLCREDWQHDLSGYDIVLFCEVMEHLYTPPQSCLIRIKGSLKQQGHLIIQTPNAAALHKRIRLLFGINPNELLRENRMGHFREYTTSEINMLLKDIKMQVIRMEQKNYFNYDRTVFHKLFSTLEFLVPGKMRDGLTCVVTKT